MEQFTIRQIEQLSGIKAPTLRIWEKRYNLIAPGRSEGRQRVYTNEDLRSILKVVYLYQRGMRISKIAALKDPQMQSFINGREESPGNFSALVAMLTEASISLDSSRINSIFNRVEKEYGFEDLVLKLIYPLLVKLGSAWVSGKIMPNNEHFVSHLVITKILSATNSLNLPPKTGRSVILFEPAGEFHEIPLLFMQYLFKKYGWQTVYFGRNIPLEIIDEYCADRKVSHLYCHMVTSLSQEEPAVYLENVSRRFPQVMVVAGGTLVQKIKAAAGNVLLLKNEDAVMNFVTS